ncbi:hypothetical protein L3Q82_002725 [Scortum barcoo]|uniref:Uncharacterized protein n=1 Tax=Scortum barcoo TaxID=214431 RepID=A0ACB8VUN9_9TELE|nr:hypothetical protein L3Q82_002725 [Scortum barcoo]
MLGTLCTLITALTCVKWCDGADTEASCCDIDKVKQLHSGSKDKQCYFVSEDTVDPNTGNNTVGVSGVTVLTQKPPVVTVRKGETATMDCNLGTVTDSSARWYKQIRGGVPQYVLRFLHSAHSPVYGSGFSSPKFTSTHQSTSDYRLIINNVEEGDSAVYYCNTWDSSAKEHVVTLLSTDMGVQPTSSVPRYCSDTKRKEDVTCPALIKSYNANMVGTDRDVNAAKVLTQTPAVHTVSTGQEVVLRCNIQRPESYYVSWYKQVPGEAPQYVLRFYHGDSSPSFGSGFSSDRFNSKSSSNIDYQFIIKRSEAGDSAVYYCATLEDSAQENVSQ